MGNKEKPINEPLSEQKKEIMRIDPESADEYLSGLDCDKLPNGYGEFGSETNPIPVNAVIGELKYLGKLRGETGRGLFYNRLGSSFSSISKKMINCYEVVCVDGTQWNELYFDIYHPRRSNIAPKGYSLIPAGDSYITYGLGVNWHLENFPFDLPEGIMMMYEDELLAEMAKSRLSQYEFKKKSSCH